MIFIFLVKPPIFPENQTAFILQRNLGSIFSFRTCPRGSFTFNTQATLEFSLTKNWTSNRNLLNSTEKSGAHTCLGNFVKLLAHVHMQIIGIPTLSGKDSCFQCCFDLVMVPHC